MAWEGKGRWAGWMSSGEGPRARKGVTGQEGRSLSETRSGEVGSWPSPCGMTQTYVLGLRLRFLAQSPPNPYGFLNDRTGLSSFIHSEPF